MHHSRDENSIRLYLVKNRERESPDESRGSGSTSSASDSIAAINSSSVNGMLECSGITPSNLFK